MDQLTNTQFITILSALVASIYLLGRVVEILSRALWAKATKSEEKGHLHLDEMKNQMKDVHAVVTRLDESGTPLVYSHDLFITQKEIIRDQKDIISTQKEIVEKLAEVSSINQSTLAGLKEVSNLNKSTLESQRELFKLLIEQKVRG